MAPSETDGTTYSATNDLGSKQGKPCYHCGEPGYEHDRERVYPDDGPPGTYHYWLHCP